MNRKLIIASLSMATVSAAFAQSAMDGYSISQPDLKGTARFMSMAGAFGALGGDLSTLSQNPAGIGVYRSGDIGFTLNLDCQNSAATAQGMKYTADQTKFLFNNIGAVLTMRLPSATVPNLNFGFTYNKAVSFNRQYGGGVPRLSNSLSNYIAGVSNSNELTENDVATTDTYDPYNPNDGGYPSPWISVLGYDSFLTNPSGSGSDTRWYGQWDNRTSGTGAFGIEERGSVDEYNIALGGNIANVVYWGMNFDIINLNYTVGSLWGETLENAVVPDRNNSMVYGTSNFDLGNYYNVNGSGFNYQLGVIVKPIQELRLGLAFHTPTWYNLTQSYYGYVNYDYSTGVSGTAETNNGRYGYNDMCFRTPMKLIASVAGVIGSKFILSFDYEWTPYNKMKFSEPGSYGIGNNWDYGYDYDDWWDYPYWAPAKQGQGPKAKAASAKSVFSDAYADTNYDINTYYQATNTFRLGAEYRITPQLSVRAGYSYTSSPVKQSVRDDKEIIYTSGTMPNYTFDNHTSYVTCGIGYRYKKFYVDMAYVYKNTSATYHAYTPDPNPDINQYIPSPQSSLSLSNNQIYLTAGFRF